MTASEIKVKVVRIIQETTVNLSSVLESRFKKSQKSPNKTSCAKFTEYVTMFFFLSGKNMPKKEEEKKLDAVISAVLPMSHS